MTDQSLPISKTTKDYVYSALVMVGLIASAALLVYLTRSSDALIMRQPRMTLVVSLALIMFFTSYYFIGRNALPFFSRPIAYASVIISAIAMGAIWIFHSDGNNSAWFRFSVLCLVITGCATVLAEVMIFYRRFFADAKWRRNIVHKIIFSLAIGLITLTMGYLYYDLGVSGGAILEYQDFRVPELTDFESQIPDIDFDQDIQGIPGEDSSQMGEDDSIVEDPDTPVSSEDEMSELP